MIIKLIISDVFNLLEQCDFTFTPSKVITANIHKATLIINIHLQPKRWTVIPPSIGAAISPIEAYPVVMPIALPNFLALNTSESNFVAGVIKQALAMPWITLKNIKNLKSLAKKHPIELIANVINPVIIIFFVL